MLVSVAPAIPRTRKSEPGRLDEHLTLCVRTGTAHLRLEDGADVRIDAGSAVCLPPGTEHDVWTEPGTLTVPIWSVEHPLGDASPIVPFPVAGRHQADLVERYSRWAWDDIAPFATDPVPLPELVVPGEPVAAPPPLPGFGPARRVAAELSRDPASDRGLEEWAAWAGCSPSTLRRGFLTQTGSTFARWRQLCRLSRAADRLVAGWRVGEAAAEVGFASRWGFTGAFRARYGMAPRDFAVRAAELAERVDAAARPTAAGDAQVPGGPLDHNVMLWVRSGELRARSAERLWVGRAGDVVWLPAGSTIESVPRSSVPLSTLCTECVQLDRPRRARFAPAWSDWLLWASISTNSLLKSAEHHGRFACVERTFHDHVIGAFHAQEAIERARRVPLPADAPARAAATAFLRALGTAGECHTHDVPADVLAAFRHETGMSFAAWRHAARMRTARRLLRNGIASSNVATRVGYSMVSNFSRAFSRFHGMGPREFQELEGDGRQRYRGSGP